MRRIAEIGLGVLFAVVMVMPACCGTPAIGSSKPLNLTPSELEIIERLDCDHAWSQLELLSSL
ncbi:MAG TPA: hypothetical protein VMW88_03805, partial [Thermoplasmata archaeon]|nr:hypothetical protein [Thermoplasmata archaeon]